MIPILYAKNETEFESNGIGVLRDAVSCSVTEERNSAFTLQMQYPITGNWYNDICEGAIIKAKANETAPLQLFRIYKSSKPMKGIVTFYANHISYDLGGLPLMALEMNGVTAEAALDAGLQSCPIQHPFTAWSDKEVLGNVSITSPRSLRNFVGGQENSILSIYGGELEFDNFAVKLHINRGSDRGVEIRYGKNLKDVKQEKNIETCYTHICPFAIKTEDVYNAAGEIIYTEEEVISLEESVIDLGFASTIGHIRTLIVDLTSEFTEEDLFTEETLREKTQEYIQAHDLSAPEINITVSIMQIWDTPEYREFAAFERIGLCDAITVRFETLGITAKAKVTKTVYDTLNERFTSLTIGGAKQSLSDTIEKITDRIDESKQKIEEGKREQNRELHNAILNATNRITGNAGGYVVLHPAANPSEILIMDTDNISTATRVWRWNSAGLGYSSNGYSGPYELAMTMDGQIVADFISAGTMSANRIKAGILSSRDGRSYFNLETGEIVMAPYEAVAERVDEIESQKMLRLVIVSSNGNIFKNGQISTTLSAKVFSWDDDITDTLDSNQFQWTRVSADSEADQQWNQAHFGGTKSIQITSADVQVRATFYCDLVDTTTRRSLLGG